MQEEHTEEEGNQNENNQNTDTTQYKTTGVEVNNPNNTVALASLFEGVFVPINTNKFCLNNPKQTEFDKMDIIDDRFHDINILSAMKTEIEEMEYRLPIFNHSPATGDVKKDIEYEDERLEKLYTMPKYEVDKQRIYITKTPMEGKVDTHVCLDAETEENAHKLLAYNELLSHSRRIYINYPMSAMKSNPSRPSDVQLQKGITGTTEPNPIVGALIKCVHLMFGMLEKPELMYWGILIGEKDTTHPLEESLHAVVDDPLGEGGGLGALGINAPTGQQEPNDEQLDQIVNEELNDIMNPPAQGEVVGAVRLKKKGPPIARINIPTSPLKHKVDYSDPSAEKATFTTMTTTETGTITTKIVFPRFTVHYIHIPYKKVTIDHHGEEEELLDNGNVFPSHQDLESVLICITLLDPTLNPVKGLQRIMEKNLRVAFQMSSEVKKKQKMSGGKELRKAAMEYGYFEQEALNAIMDPACDNGMEKLFTLDDWVFILGNVTGNFGKLNSFLSLSSVKKEDLFVPGGILDPCVFLSPETMYNWSPSVEYQDSSGNLLRKERQGGLKLKANRLTSSGEFTDILYYRYAELCNMMSVSKQHRTSREFLSHPQVSPKSQLFPIKIRIQGSVRGLGHRYFLQEPNAVQGKLMCFWSPIRTIMIPKAYLSPADFMLSRFFTKVNTASGVEKHLIFVKNKKPSPTFPFPPITELQSAALAESIRVLKTEMMLNWIFKSVKEYLPDRLRKLFFQYETDEKHSALIPRELPLDGRVSTLREEIFRDFSKSFMSTNPELAIPVSRFLSKIEQDYMFSSKNNLDPPTAIPNILDMDFKLFSINKPGYPLSPISLWDINYLGNYLHWGKGVWMTHRILYALVISQQRQFRQDNGIQPGHLLYGDTSIGKSILAGIITSLLGGNMIVKKKDDNSAKALLTDTNAYTTGVLIKDDAPMSSPYFHFIPPDIIKKTSGGQEIQRIKSTARKSFPEQQGVQFFKTGMTEGVFVYMRNDGDGLSSRRTVEIKVCCKVTTIDLTNVHPVNMHDSCANRFMIYYLRNIMNLISKPRQLEQIAIYLDSISTAYTTWCLYWGQYVRAACIFYHEEKNRQYCSAYFERVKQISEKKLGIKLNTVVRISDETLFKTVESCMFHRLYALSCLGVFTNLTESNLLPGCAFNDKMFLELSYFGAYLISEDDFIRGLSLLEDIFQPRPFVVMMKHILLQLKKNNKYSEELIEQPNKCEKEWNRTAFATSFSSPNMNLPKDIPNVDYNYLDITFCFGLKTEDWKSEFTATLAVGKFFNKLFNTIDANEYLDELDKWREDWNFPVGRYVDKVEVSLGNSRSLKKVGVYDEVEIQNPNGEFIKIPSDILQTIEAPVLKINYFEQKIYLNRGFVDFYLKTSLFSDKGRISETMDGFAASYVEAIFREFSYIGCRKRSVVLPGCTLDLRDDYYSTEILHPRIPKYIKLCPPALDSQDPLRYFVISSDSTQPKYLEPDYENSWYIKHETPEDLLILTDMDAYNYLDFIKDIEERKEWPLHFIDNVPEPKIDYLLKHFSPAALDYKFYKIRKDCAKLSVKYNIPMTYDPEVYMFPDDIINGTVFNGNQENEQNEKQQSKKIDMRKYYPSPPSPD